MSTRMLGLAVLLLSAVSAANAQNDGKYVWEEYGKRISAGQDTAALTSDLFGEQVNLYDGSLSFQVTDVSIPGNSALPVAFSRSFTIRDKGEIHTWVYNDFPLEDWEIVIPNISGVFSQDWVGSTPGNPGKRCSVHQASAGAPPQITVAGDVIHPKEYWHGNMMDLGGAGGGELLYAGSGVPMPTTGGPYYWVTSDHTRISCLASIKNWTGGGEGFLAVTADGTKYWFDWMAQFEEPSLSKPVARDDGATYTRKIGRRRNVLYASRVEDRHGNYVEYNYVNTRNEPVKLTSIRSNDGRRIDIAYDGARVSRVTVGERIWRYEYSATTGPDGTLSAVILPDGSRWTIGFAGLHGARVEYEKAEPGNPNWRNCTRLPQLVGSQSFIGTVVHPSGATGEFTVSIQRHGRSNVPVTCENFTTPYNDRTDDLASWPIYYDGLSLKSKRIHGPGLDAMQWNYNYDGSYSFFYPSGNANFPVCPVSAGDCSLPRCVSADCAGSKATKVTAPDGSWTRYSYGNSYRYNEGKLLKVEVGKGESGPVRVMENEYDLSQADQVYPARWGLSPRMGSEGFSSEYHRPQTAARITEQGAVFGWSANAFDTLARPLSVTRSSTLAGSPSKTEVTTYHDNLGKWVLGQPARLVVNGIVASETTYHATSALPTVYRQFGKVVQTLGYHTDGTVSTVKDGNDNVTTLSSWKRGVPQSIRYPATPEAQAGATQSAVVNDHGWITRVTDENGFQSNYQYDPVGRLSQITYPGGDSTAWNVTAFTFTKATASAYGIPAGHWQHTEATGNGRKVSYLDALWRPLLVREYDSANASGTQRFTRQVFDHDGRTLFASYPSASGTPTTGVWSEYDPLGRPTSVSQDSELGLLTTTTSYLSDATGPYTLVTTPRGQQTRTWYQMFDQPSYDSPTRITHPEGAVTDIVRDVFGKPLSLTRGNSSGSTAITRSYVYNSYQELCKTVEPETGATLMGYDGAGNLVWSKAGATQGSLSSCNATDIPAAQRTVRSYDARNRIQSLVFPDGLGNTTYSYTPDSKPTQITARNAGGNDVTTVYTYNRRRLLTGEAMDVGGYLWGIGYGYNANAHLDTHVLPSGLEVGYAPNALGQPTRVGSYATGISYFPNGGIKGFTYGNGVVHTLTQNVRGLPDRSRDVHGTVAVHDDGMDYDTHGNVAAISDGLPGARGNRTMTYDGLDRLKQVDSPMFGVATYTYDVLDNLRTMRLTAGTNARNHTYGYDASHRLTSIANTSGGGTVATLSYDVQGNLASKNGLLHQFDHGNRLREVVGVEQYRYDGHGRRVQAIRNGSSIYSFYGGDGVLRFQRDERSGNTIEYMYLGSSLIAQLKSPIPLATPTLTVAGYSSTGSYAVNWTSTSLAVKYQLQEQFNGGDWNTIHDAAGTSKNVTGKTVGSYGYRVRACSAANCGNWSATATVTVQLPPSSVPGLSVPSVGFNGSFTAGWNSVAAASKYELQEQLNGGSWALVHDAAGTSREFAGKAAGTYGYRVRACNDAGCGGYSAISTVQVIYKPASAPTLTVPASNFTGAYTASWTTVATTTRYELQQRKDGGGWALVHDAPAASKQLSGLLAGTYDHRVRACNAAGCGSYSAIKSTQLTLPPAGVATLTAPAMSSTGAYTLSWTTVATTTRYELQQRKDGGSWALVHDLAATSKALSGLTSGSYDYRVRACNIGGCAGYSAMKTVRVVLPPTSAPVLTVPGSSGTGSYSVGWTAVSAATRYELQERLGSAAWATIQDTASTSRSISSRSNGSWGYRVQACNEGGCGPYSAVRTINVQLLTPPTPTGLNVVRASGGETCAISWNASAGATSYRLSRGATLYEGPELSFTQYQPCMPSYTIAACNSHGCSAPSSAVGPSGSGGGGGVRPTTLASDEEVR